MINYFQILNQVCINVNSAQYLQLSRRIEKAKQMSFNGYTLWGELTADTAIGVIQSQSDRNKYYYTFIRADGTFGCFDNELEPCLGQPLYLSNYQRQFQRNRHRNQHNEFEEFGIHNEYRARWEYGQPCKHVFSLLNGFCARADSSIQNLLEKWITVSLKGGKKPVRDSTYASYIQSRFDPIRNRVLERSVFTPLVNSRNNIYSLYKPSKNVKILDSHNSFSEEPVLELHIEITGEGIKSLPLKNSICISCLKREQEPEILKNWFKCKNCLSLLCEVCYTTLQQDSLDTCPSVFNGYKRHKLDVIRIDEVIQNKPTEPKETCNNFISEDLLFKFGDN